MKKVLVFLFLGVLFINANDLKEVNNSKKQNDNSTVKAKSVGHVGGFAVSGRVSTIIDRNSTGNDGKEIKEIKSKK